MIATTSNRLDQDVEAQALGCALSSFPAMLGLGMSQLSISVPAMREELSIPLNESNTRFLLLLSTKTMLQQLPFTLLGLKSILFEALMALSGLRLDTALLNSILLLPRVDNRLVLASGFVTLVSLAYV